MRTNAEKTLESIKKINGFPFYTAKYYGDYKINDFKNGAVKSPDDVVPFFQSLFKELGMPIEISFSKPPEMNIGCSAFFCRDKNNSVIIAKNNDWKRDPLILLKTEPCEGFSSYSMVNLRFCDFFGLGSFKHSILLAPYVPLDGMNEKGLCVAALAVHEGSEYPLKPQCVSVGDFNLIRILLDSCSEIDEALNLIKQYNIMQTGPLPVHLLIADRKESCIIEFFNGDMHVQRDPDVNYLTNFLKLKESDFHEQRRLCERYQVLEDKFKTEKSIMNVLEAEKLLSEVSVYTEGFRVPSTIYSVVYRPDDLNIKVKVGDNLNYYSINCFDRLM